MRYFERSRRGRLDGLNRDALLNGSVRREAGIKRCRSCAMLGCARPSPKPLAAAGRRRACFVVNSISCETASKLSTDSVVPNIHAWVWEACGHQSNAASLLSALELARRSQPWRCSCRLSPFEIGILWCSGLLVWFRLCSSLAIAVRACADDGADEEVGSSGLKEGVMEEMCENYCICMRCLMLLQVAGERAPVSHYSPARGGGVRAITCGHLQDSHHVHLPCMRSASLISFFTSVYVPPMVYVLMETKSLTQVFAR